MKPSEEIRADMAETSARKQDRGGSGMLTWEDAFAAELRWLDANWPPPAPPQDAEAEKLVSEFEDAVRSLPGITSLGGGSTAARTALLSYIAGLRRQIALLEADAPEAKT